MIGRTNKKIRVFDTVGVSEDVGVRSFETVGERVDEGVFVLDRVGVCNTVDVVEMLGVRVVDAVKMKMKNQSKTE